MFSAAHGRGNIFSDQPDRWVPTGLKVVLLRPPSLIGEIVYVVIV